ncbi:tRNA 2-selenouridine(34) synthase MnmH [Clostridium senegalense]
MFQTTEYKELKGDYVLVDVRSPLEYKENTIPGAVNIPLFNDEERALVGTIYKQESTEKAKKIGMEIVSKKLPSIYDEFLKLEKKHKKIVLFCARGGMRSGSLVALLSSLGMRVEKIKGGYKSYRGYVLEELPKLNEQVKYIVLHGNTGVGKTEILKKLKFDGYDILDLEGFANHRGSILGSVGLGDVNSQKKFESLILDELKHRNSDFVFIEAESKRIGRVIIPEYIHESMKKGIHIFVDADLDFRCNLIVKEYTKCKTSNEEICDSIIKIKKILSKECLEEFCEKVMENDYEEVVKELMVKYYDPMYMHSANQYDYDLKIFVSNIEKAAEELECFVDNHLKK